MKFGGVTTLNLGPNFKIEARVIANLVPCVLPNKGIHVYFKLKNFLYILSIQYEVLEFESGEGVRSSDHNILKEICTYSSQSRRVAFRKKKAFQQLWTQITKDCTKSLEKDTSSPLAGEYLCNVRKLHSLYLGGICLRYWVLAGTICRNTWDPILVSC